MGEGGGRETSEDAVQPGCFVTHTHRTRIDCLSKVTCKDGCFGLERLDQLCKSLKIRPPSWYVGVFLLSCSNNLTLTGHF